MKSISSRLTGWNLGHLSFPTIVRIFLGVSSLVVVVVLGIFMIDVALFLLGSQSPLDTDVWGTYAAWAGAILPTLGVTVTAATWLAGRHAESVQAAEEAALRVIVERRPGAVTSLQNDSEWPLIVVGSTPAFAENSAKVVRPHAPRLLFTEDTTSVTIRIRGCAFELGISGTLTRVG